MQKVIILLVLFLAIFGQIGAQETEGTEDEKKSLYPALLGGVFTNTVFHLTSRLFGADFAQTSLESIKTNLESPWIWDSDAFLFNHPGHPYQGGLYHAAARSNGFNFYESILFDATGSLTWELFGETDIPSLNDLVVTTFGGAAFGEMLHLLYLEIDNPWAAALVSPMDALNNAVLQKKPPRTNNLYYISASLAPGWIRSIKEDRQILRQLRDSDINLTPSNIYTINMDGEVIYGDPFIHNSKKPYSQFEVKWQLGGSFDFSWFDWTLLTDGYLISINPIDTEKNSLSTGLSMQYDMIVGNNTNFASNALDWSQKWKHTFKNTTLELKTHIGWTFLGSSEYYPFAELSGMNLDPHETDNDYGIGGNGKIFFTLQNSKYGKLTLGSCNYLLYIIPWNKPESKGREYLHMSFFEYAYSFTEKFSIFVNDSLYIKTGTSHRRANVVSVADRILLGVQWTFLNKNL
ncbi:conserved hypothetical protein [Treponema primitia ZAS-2]|uniref:DUF3943 domain-containing protein n=1 Tax=Treponema primitia (strain ATCC BAA-887 / DSM 12427 / ZAS-2) TaxID=545694 RepID=F5YPP9_TREPZ|nr:DUF3943 domain-containing protein [Treponema primitia]AEF85458.1 conserved hypothetical protein [Treponema primitia ZAS-2]